jgi:hypothetical protein
VSELTTNPDDPRLTHGADSEPVPMAEAYLILSESERAKGFVRPVRRHYIHDIGERACHTITWMSEPLAETYARNPGFYGSTYCVTCQMHCRVGEFHWAGTNEVVGS